MSFGDSVTRLRDLTPQSVARYRAELEADGVGVEAIRKTLTMMQGVLQRAVEWQRVRSNPFKLARKPPARRLHAVRAMPPAVIEAMRSDLLSRGRHRDAMLVVLLGYAGLRPQEALALQSRHVRERTILVERAVSDGRLKALKNRSQPRTVDLLEPLRADLLAWRPARAHADENTLLFRRPDGGLWRESDWRNWRKRLYAPAAAAAGVQGARPYDLRHSFASLADPRGTSIHRRDRGADGPSANGLPRHVRARDGGTSRNAGRERRDADPGCPHRSDTSCRRLTRPRSGLLAARPAQIRP